MPVKTSLNIISLLMLCWSAAASAANPVYEKNCMACHGEGVAGAPRVGEVEAWKERLPKGNRRDGHRRDRRGTGLLGGNAAARR
jgi:mono/diheme cytochrome c family protein